MTLAVIGILYGAHRWPSRQTDLKRLVAYTSVSHMGFVLLGIFAWNELALQGALLIIIAHGISTGALFILVGALNDRIHTRDLDRMGGCGRRCPGLGGVWLFFALASLGLPGLGEFVGEFLVLLGTYPCQPALRLPRLHRLHPLRGLFAVDGAARLFGPPSLQGETAGFVRARMGHDGQRHPALPSGWDSTPQPVLDTAGGAIQNLMQGTIFSADSSYSSENGVSNGIVVAESLADYWDLHPGLSVECKRAWM